MNQSVLEQLESVILKGEIVTEEQKVLKLSKDYYWYSPVLKDDLEEKKADFIVIPDNTAEVSEILQIARNEQIPVTIRGAGTGNYGQAIPMTGGVVVDLSRLNKVIDMQLGYVKVEAGMRLRDLEKQANVQEQELTIYPSTFAKATVGGFVSGGSGGVGSVTWGNLWDGNVLAATVMTMTDPIEIFTVQGNELKDYIHSYGTTGVLVDVTLPLKPKHNWRQLVLKFDGLSNTLKFTREIAESSNWKKRLVTVLEAPIPSFFKPLKKVITEEGDYAFLEVADEQYEAILSLAKQFKGKEVYTVIPDNYRKGIGISDFTWNHTTLWALKADTDWTYLQNFFELERFEEQIELIKAKFGDEVLIHIEWLRDRGRLIPAGLPLVKYSSKERLYEVIDFFNRNGASVNDPHTYLLGAGGWNLQLESIANKKKINDPYDLLNQGKLPTPEQVSAS
ncbi:FAD-linked oxidase [Alkalihalobacillus alcalophilus ATCC 27647 = CGMCC 1.3604]|uniref:FAD-linked oxidase n=1 Tax=Alkalihalobacillus alcalophilus ATCC 27647 = CGMCC 1.3604 TaxID=1218173 RepID=A0A094WL37_ALKAL|nr:FAD-binding oxidoreductase [Alkalihalobacillus alcalophilus]KGA97576.1 FAD-linked oxidase [Alkalihalobacillus alcalophilus ATCC 27647 = CGMCC 1.3604]MED1562960.1 FAD-binding oxidoreductase [Alkalihalobacillus alcalophilus]THG91145.1 FAD-linked oxidase [Alkalihalobacillus alcalophilus ATCC 27647 = CGMCC 1.3604]